MTWWEKIAKGFGIFGIVFLLVVLFIVIPVFLAIDGNSRTKINNDRIYLEEHTAAINGLPCESCPYEKCDRTIWLKAWTAAKLSKNKE